MSATEDDNVADITATREESQVSVPSSPTPPDSETTESKISRKREREVSLEPATPQATTVDSDPERPENKERRTPAKKNRVSATLGAPQEQDEDADADIEIDAASTSGSPPHETKIRQISRGVEDITWQRKDAEMKESTEHTSTPTEEAHDVEPAPTVESQSEREPAQVLPPSTQDQGENPPLVYDAAEADDEHPGAADPAEKPPAAQPAHSPSQLVTAPEPVALTRTPPPLTGRDSDSDPEQDKGANLKRKMADRSVSERLLPVRSDSGTVAAGKRARDEDEDSNPRETKRPTPPPEEDEVDVPTDSKKGTKSPRKLSTERSTAPSSASTSTAASSATSSATSTPKASGFMAYASSSSPFANVAGPSIFGQSKVTTSPWASSATASPAPSSSAFTSTPTNTLVSPTPLKQPSSIASSSQPTTSTQSSQEAAPSSSQKRTGFEAFAGVSPFASAAKRPRSPPPAPLFGSRSKSPARLNAFSAYAGAGVHGFTRAGAGGAAVGLGISETRNGSEKENGVPESGEEDEDGERKSEKKSSFGDRLRASKDQESEDGSEEEKVTKLTEQEVVTGEENDDTIYQVRGKLYALSSQNQWKERGTGTIRLNVRRSDGAGARLVMRKEAVYTVMLNATLFKGMRVFLAQDPRYLRFSVFESGATTHYNLRVASAKIAAELLEEINSHIPGA